MPVKWRTFKIRFALARQRLRGAARHSQLPKLNVGLGTPYDITLHELRVECFFPADDATEDACRRLASP